MKLLGNTIALLCSFLFIINCSKNNNTPTPGTKKQYSFAVISSPTEGGSVLLKTNSGAFSGSNNSGNVEEGSSITLTANPISSYTFKEWNGDLTGTSNPSTLTVNKNTSITALFEKTPNTTISTSTTTSTTTTTTTTTTSTTTTSSKTIQLAPLLHKETGLGVFTKKSIVFGIRIYASSSFPDSKVEHAASILAQYLDNDEDGTPDNADLHNILYERKAYMILHAGSSDLEGITLPFPAGSNSQDLGADETVPEWHTNGGTGRFDAALEEVLHLVTSQGYHYLYPQIFGEMAGSEIANAMDIARGGQFTKIPASYPSGAWYTYDDMTCEYNCQVSEYIYWSLTSILGAQAKRLGDIKEEWQLNTLDLIKQRDPAGYKLMTNPIYKWATVLPDGSYNPKTN